MKTKKPDEVLLIIDWDNFFLSLFGKFKEKINTEFRIQKLIEWVKTSIGPIFEGYGFLFAPEHLSKFDREMCTKNNLRIIICPKKNSSEGQEDTVDETLMWFGSFMMRHPDIRFICLVSADEDYLPMMEAAKKLGIKRALAVPTIEALSRSKKLVKTADQHPKTKKKMIFRLDSLPENIAEL